jgi:hypothetical protein
VTLGGESVVVVLAILVAGGGALQAQGGPPVRMDDPGTPGPGHREVNLAVTGERFDASFRERTVVCSLGAREEVVAHYTLLAALGSGAGGSAADRPHISFYLGLQSVR